MEIYLLYDSCAVDAKNNLYQPGTFRRAFSSVEKLVHFLTHTPSGKEKCKLRYEADMSGSLVYVSTKIEVYSTSHYYTKLTQIYPEIDDEEVFPCELNFTDSDDNSLYTWFVKKIRVD